MIRKVWIHRQRLLLPSLDLLLLLLKKRSLRLHRQLVLHPCLTKLLYKWVLLLLLYTARPLPILIRHRLHHPGICISVRMGIGSIWSIWLIVALLIWVVSLLYMLLRPLWPVYETSTSTGTASISAT